MNYIIVDFEWNQACSAEEMIQYPIRLNGEIIQIGAVKLNEKLEEIDRFDVLIRPRCYRRLHWNVARLTHIQESDLRKGEKFQRAIRMFQQWCGEDFCFMTWGFDDEPMLRDNLRIYSMDTNWIPPVYNLQVLFAHQYQLGNRQISLTNAVQQLNEEGLEAHNALHDALNTAMVCRHLNIQAGLKEYEEHMRIMLGYQQGDTAGIMVSCWAEAFEKPEITGFECPQCKKQVECEGWATKAPDKRIALANCPECSKYYVQVKFRKKAEKSYRVSRTIYPLTEELQARYDDNLANEKKRLAKYHSGNYPSKTELAANAR